MAMMMTGRVLLVCALCVLWCGGAGGGGCTETTTSNVAPDTEKNLQSKDNTIRGAEVNGNNGQPADLHRAEASVSDVKKAEAVPGAAAQPAAQATEAMEEKKGSKDEKTQKEIDADTKKQIEDDVKYDEENKNDNEKDDEEKQEEEEEEKEDADEEDVKQKEDEEKKKEGNVTGTTKGMSAGSQEQPISPSDAEGASNQTKPKNTQTPVEATFIKHTTATTGDSDGSTAVSHTTSPLLLLLLVACAAVVAA
ncbi:mucin-associated surface protein (MASP), putative [Trypanosoma cruzi marinkellei]|uniref:Mucin-associated surface protein (MASP), putative n=1 Tax=Trypanosoma cruzi marinkellei TaxID=85056 RepID=K2MUH5_TRYCR|nr:mucin-associated surface protein (MASP), putative [Trypanosoma cruzi marinkellei]